MKAIIISLRESGENNRLVRAVSVENGVFSAMLYGGPKSHLRSLVQPFYSGVLYLYTDERKGTSKITDFDVKNAHPSLRTSLFKSWASSFSAELLMKTDCAGESSKSFPLLSALLDGIDLVDENEARIGLLRFIWRYLALLGMQPEIGPCAYCGLPILRNGDLAIFSEKKNGFVCKDCLVSSGIDTENSYKLKEKELTYLSAITNLTPGKVREIQLSSDSIDRLRRFLYSEIERASGVHLETLASGAGIL